MRIKNVPQSANHLAIARSVYANIAYFDSQGGRELFPSVTGAWISPDGGMNYEAVEALSSNCPNLRPHRDSAYLGIAIGYFLSSSDPKEYGALTASSPRYRDWIDLDVLLNNRVPDGIVNIKVTLGCDGFQTTRYYILRADKAEKNFSLTSASHVQHITVSVR